MLGSSWAIWGHIGHITTPTCNVIHVCPEQMAQQIAQHEPNIAHLSPNMGPRWVQVAQGASNIAPFSEKIRYVTYLPHEAVVEVSNVRNLWEEGVWSSRGSKVS